jgi:hypothetical protein
MKLSKATIKVAGVTRFMVLTVRIGQESGTNLKIKYMHRAGYCYEE